jgi:hypothetical protein
MSLLAGESFTKFWFHFESILKVFQKVSNKNRKEKREGSEKNKRGLQGKALAQAAKRPMARYVSLPNRYLSPLSSLATMWAPQ